MRNKLIEHSNHVYTDSMRDSDEEDLDKLCQRSPREDGIDGISIYADWYCSRPKSHKGEHEATIYATGKSITWRSNIKKSYTRLKPLSEVIAEYEKERKRMRS